MGKIGFERDRSVVTCDGVFNPVEDAQCVAAIVECLKMLRIACNCGIEAGERVLGPFVPQQRVAALIMGGGIIGLECYRDLEARDRFRRARDLLQRDSAIAIGRGEIGFESDCCIEAFQGFGVALKGAKRSASIAVGGSAFGIDPGGKRELPFALCGEAALQIDNAERMSRAEMRRIGSQDRLIGLPGVGQLSATMQRNCVLESCVQGLHGHRRASHNPITKLPSPDDRSRFRRYCSVRRTVSKASDRVCRARPYAGAVSRRRPLPCGVYITQLWTRGVRSLVLTGGQLSSLKLSQPSRSALS